MSFYDFWNGLLLTYGSSHGTQTRWVGGALSNLGFVSNFLASCY